MASAGWIATSVGYSWLLAFGLLGLIGLAKIIRDEQLKGVEYPFYFICNLIGIGSLQLSPLLLGFYAIAAIYLLIKKRYSIFVFIQLFVIIANLIFQLTTPGLRSRFTAEIIYSFPVYESFTFADMLQLGFLSTVFHYINDSSLFFLLFCFVLFIGVCVKQKRVHYRVIAFIPLLFNLLWGSFNHVFGGFPGHITHTMLTAGSHLIVNVSNFFHYRAYIPLGLAFLFSCYIAVSMFLIFGKTYKSLLVQLILLGGFASRMIMSFSPTVFNSGERTFIFMYFCMIICAAMIFQELCLKLEEKHQLYIIYGSGTVAVLIVLERIYMMG